MPLWLLPVLLVLHFWRWGYAYGSGDHDEILPQLLHALDPGLFAHDPFVQSQAGAVTVRTVWLGMLHALSWVMPVSAAVFVGYVVSLVAVFVFVYRLGFALVPDRLAALGGTVVAAVLLPRWTLGGNGLTSGLFTPSLTAFAFALPALWLYLDGRRVWAAALFGAASWFQVLVGIQLVAVLGAAALVLGALRRDALPTLGETVRFGAVFALVAAPVVVPVMLAPPHPAAATAELSTFRVLAELRVPHHYLAGSFGLGAYAKFGLLVVAGTGALGWLHRRGRLQHGRFVGCLLALVAAVLVGAAALTEGVPVLFVAKLQLFKLTVTASLLFALAVGAAGAFLLQKRAGMRGLEGVLFDRPAVGWAASLVLLGGTVALAAAGVGRPGALWRPAAYAQSDEAAVARWVRAETDRDAVFLVPPSNTTFRMAAHRSVAINFKPTPYQPGAIHHWFGRLRTAAPAPLPERGGLAFTTALDSAYHAHSAREWGRVGAALEADYALVDLDALREAPAGSAAFRSGRWAVYRLSGGPVE